MSTPEKGKAHSHPKGGPDDGAVTGIDWFKVLDVAVWVCVGVIAIMGVEWLVGKVIRESVTAGANRILQKAAPASPDAA